MNVKELCGVFQHDQIHLHGGRDGKLIAKTRKGLEPFGEVEVRTCYCKIECGKESNWARSYVYAFGDSVEIDRIKQEGVTK